MLIRVLLATGSSTVRKKIKDVLSTEDVVVDVVKGTRRLWERLARESGDLVIVSRDLIPDPPDATVRIVGESPESPDVIVLDERDDPEERALLFGAGCETVISPKLPEAVLQEILAAILEKRREISARRFVARTLGGPPRLSDFVSASPAMQTFMGVVERVVVSDTSLLILGETGVGKERLARAIHAESPHSQGPFIAVNCGALPESLLESELFGHEEGAFTGATRARRGMFEMAHEGTIFLDEIGEMPLHLQVKLLRVLQEHEIQRIGGERLVQVKVRIMAATNRDLAEAVETKQFRRDLFYRLSVVTLTLPPLRERREDIPDLVVNYIDFFSNTIGQSVEGIEERTLAALVEYDWPGNVRELSNVIERAVLLCTEEKITMRDIPENIQGDARISFHTVVPMEVDSPVL
ncbi:MAG: sigma 54-interacting transcriptional regulator, partial [Planctomycetota bacterium]